MTKSELIAARLAERKLAYGDFDPSPTGHIFNKPPTNKEEAHQHGNALAAAGNYPVGTSECFNVGISGGCGPDCYIYREGRCDEPEEMVPSLEGSAEIAKHRELYPLPIANATA